MRFLFSEFHISIFFIRQLHDIVIPHGWLQLAIEGGCRIDPSFHFQLSAEDAQAVISPGFLLRLVSRQLFRRRQLPFILPIDAAELIADRLLPPSRRAFLRRCSRLCFFSR